MKGLMMDYQLTVDRILEYAFRMFPAKTILTKTPQGPIHEYTYREFYGRVKRLANVLESLGVESGDRVGTFGWNNYQHLEMYYAIPGAGAVCHTLNIRLSPEQLSFVIRHAEDRIIFVDGTLLPLIEKVADELDGVRHFVLYNVDSGVTTKLPRVSFYEDLMSKAADEYEWKCRDEQDALGLCYTSGTTGDPKGVLYSHRSTFLHALGASMGCALSIRDYDSLLLVVPQFHVMAWGAPFFAILNGADLVLPGPHLQCEVLADLIADHKITIALGVPTIWMMLYQELKTRPRDVSSLRALVVGGAAMPRSLLEAYEKEFGVNVIHAWGMTETSPLGTVSVPRKHHGELPEKEIFDMKAKQGYPVPMVDMRIVNELGEELPWDGSSVGEVQVRGPWVSREYFRLEKSSDNFTSDGWFRTGDVASISHDGSMTITDRAKDLVKSGGEWISSVALENALMAHPKVAEAAVIAIPDKKWDERPLAVVVPAPGAQPASAEELQEHLAPHFMKFWLPDRYVFVDQIPKTSVGKFDKKVLRRQFVEGQLK